ncbi:MAG: hypothetical protein AB7O65_08370 [Candidatus Korobacteraceae bacterium]
MQADYTIELGSEDPTLTVPWESPDGGLRYRDLRQYPDFLLYIEEAIRYPELGEFLARINGERSLLQSAKCDVWFTAELNEEELIYGAAGKFGGYIDLFFSDSSTRSDFPANEELARRLVALLVRAPELPSSAELIIRRGYFDWEGHSESGYYFTCYVFGYGDEEAEARRHWTVSLKLVENALLQLVARKAESL